eukprot:2743228-Rhodomonas_salina.2
MHSGDTSATVQNFKGVCSYSTNMLFFRTVLYYQYTLPPLHTHYYYYGRCLFEVAAVFSAALFAVAVFASAVFPCAVFAGA